MNNKFYKIGVFSKKVALSIDTLRYYEKEKLIIPKRDHNNLRIYDDNDVQWLEFIKRLKLTGMPLKEIKVYAQLRYQGDSTIDKRLQLLYHQKSRLQNQAVTIQEHINFLNNKIDIYQTNLKEYQTK